MKKREYRITMIAKILIIQFLLTLSGLAIGCTWRIYAENKKWDMLIYPGVQLAGFDLGGKTKEEAKHFIQIELMNSLRDKQIKMVLDDHVYHLDCSDLIAAHCLNDTVDRLFHLGKNLSWYQKHQWIKNGSAKQYPIYFRYNEDYIDQFIEMIEKDIYREPVNASLQKMPDGTIQIQPEMEGRRLQKEKLKKYIQEKVNNGPWGDMVIQIPVEMIAAGVTADALSCIDTMLASFHTSFAASSPGRAHNIQLAAEKICGTLLMPGEIFSFNECVGPRTKERGFREGPVIIDNKIGSGLGGGVCQVSSTLYNAILKVGIKPIERRCHSVPSKYVGLGLDATVDWGNIDFKFQNTFDYPIWIESDIQNFKLYFNIYSHSSLAKREYAIKNHIYKTIPPKTRVLEDTGLPPDKISVVQSGQNGYRVKVIRDVYEQGRLVDSEVISDDYYASKERIIKKGVSPKTNYHSIASN